jgi:hypothetical protein
MGKNLEEILMNNKDEISEKEIYNDNYSRGSLYESIIDNYKNKKINSNLDKEIYGKKEYINEKNYIEKIIENPYKIYSNYSDKISSLENLIKYNDNKIENKYLDLDYSFIKSGSILKELEPSQAEAEPAAKTAALPQPIILVPARTEDAEAVRAIFGNGAKLLALDDVANDARNAGQRVVVDRDGELVHSYVKRFVWEQDPGVEVCYRRESLLLPALFGIGCDTPEVFGTHEAGKRGRIAMRQYDAETFEDRLMNMGGAEKIAYLKRVVSSLVKMQHLAGREARNMLTELGNVEMDEATKEYFVNWMLKASERISGRKVDKRELSAMYLVASNRLGRAQKYPVHQDFTPRNVLVTREGNKIIITDTEFMSLPGRFDTGGPLTLDYSTLMQWPGVELSQMDEIELDRHFVSEWNKRGNPITMNEFYQLKADTDLVAAKRFAGVYAMLYHKNPTQKNYDRHMYFMGKMQDSAASNVRVA